jgi:hypothetical protein
MSLYRRASVYGEKRTQASIRSRGRGAAMRIERLGRGRTGKQVFMVLSSTYRVRGAGPHQCHGRGTAYGRAQTDVLAR